MTIVCYVSVWQARIYYPNQDLNKLETGDQTMLYPINVEVKPEEIIEAVKRMKKRERDAFLEDLLAATSPAYHRFKAVVQGQVQRGIL